MAALPAWPPLTYQYPLARLRASENPFSYHSPPSLRYEQFKALKYPRKVVTIEPVLDFDLPTFVSWIRRIEPEYVWLGFNSKPESVKLPEPSAEKVQKFMEKLAGVGIKIQGKTLRGLQVPLQ